jgi:putative DNA primase/helicase
MPNLQAMDEGIRRRIVVIPFRNHLTEEEIDRDLADKLLEEADAILYWLIQGYYRYTVHGLKPPAAVRQTTATYFAEQDIYQLFVEEHYIKDPDGKVYAKTLYQNYQHWCAENGEKAVSNIVFGKEMQRLAIPKTRGRQGYYYALREKEPDGFDE